MKLDIRSLLSAYRDGSTTPEKVITELKKKIAEAPASIWISHTSDESLSRYLKNLHLKSPRDLPLYGIPFAIKDNIDLENCETTAGCPAFAYTPNRSATVVGKLIRAGAIPLGKTSGCRPSASYACKLSFLTRRTPASPRLKTPDANGCENAVRFSV